MQQVMDLFRNTEKLFPAFDQIPPGVDPEFAEQRTIRVRISATPPPTAVELIF
jgi:hypothetical protein